MAHSPVKVEKLAAHAAAVLEGEIVLPNLMTKRGYEDFRGALGDTVTVRVPGVLPARTYGWRNDRTNAIETDEYSETKVTVEIGDNIYSAVNMTDEQAELDFSGYAALINSQVQGVGRGIEGLAADAVASAPYEVSLGVAEGEEHAGFVEARRVLNVLRAPAEQRIMLVGSTFEAALLNNDKFNRADSVGDGAANSALRQASIRNWMGFTVVASTQIDPDAAYAFVPSAFVFLSAAPATPASVPFGASASHNGISLRWVRDYDAMHMQDRSVVNTWAGFNYTTDRVVGKSVADGETNVTTETHLVRAIKLELNGTSEYPTGDLADVTGLTDPASS